MRAESIEQIREHLARGGKVATSYAGEVVSVFGDRVCIRPCRGKNFYAPFSSRDFLLLPIEEELTDEEVDAEIARLGIDAKALPIVTEDPTGESRRKTPNILIDGKDTGAGERIRKALLFGHYPDMNDLRDWWQATTGERIEWGRSCEKCGGEGVQTLAFYGRGIEEPIMSQPCPACKDHPGYTVRPTWMEDQCQPQ
jgi:hypothetical protein